ncbi:MAG: M20 family metallopeptidase [Chloroflexota bacterium]
MLPLNDDAARRVLAAIDDAETIAFLQEIVRIPSVNPPGDVADAIAVCHRKLAAEGFRCRIDPNAPGHDNLIAEIGTGRPRLIFNAHLDVVPTGEEAAWTYPPFSATIADGRVYGRGAGDDKASVTAQVMAGVALARSGVSLAGTLIVNEVADEETSGGGILHCLDAGLEADMAIVGEQTLGRVAVGEKGSAPTDVVVHGRTAHGALPWEGANAIEGMARVIVALSDELLPRLAGRTHPFFHPSSSSVNMISGGVKANVVPDRCSIYVDRRLAPGETPEQARAEILEIAERAIAGMPGLRVEILKRTDGLPASLSDPESPLVRGMVAANAWLGLDTTLTGFSMATDGRFIAQRGIPTIIYGPGDPKLAHVPNEWVGVDEVLAATRAYALAALALIGA